MWPAKLVPKCGPDTSMSRLAMGPYTVACLSGAQSTLHGKGGRLAHAAGMRPG